MSKILITRPVEKAEDAAREIAELGFSPLIAPVLQVVPMDFDLPDAASYGGLLFTSGHAVRIFAQALPPDSPYYALPVYCVGAQTLQAAEEAGFSSARSAQGDVQDLVALVTAIKADKPYLHVRGKHVSAPLHVLLGAKGVKADILQVYDTVFSSAFAADVLEALRGGDVQAVMLYSRRSAQAFVALVDQHGLADILPAIKVLSISKAVLGCVQSYEWQEQFVAKSPDKLGFYKLLQDVCVPA